jgi:hypothetical protein
MCLHKKHPASSLACSTLPATLQSTLPIRPCVQHLTCTALTPAAARAWITGVCRTNCGVVLRGGGATTLQIGVGAERVALPFLGGLGEGGVGDSCWEPQGEPQ